MGWLSAINATFRFQIFQLNIEISKESVPTRDGGNCYKLRETGCPEGVPMFLSFSVISFYVCCKN